MKVSYPLSLKVSVWLMMNLLLLAVLGIGFLVMRGGMGWDALVAGPTGTRIQGLADVIAGEVSAATAPARNAVLERFGTAYNADLFLFTLDETQVAGAPVELPAEVRARMEYRPGGYRPGGFGSRGGGRRGGRPEAETTIPREAAEDPAQEGAPKTKREASPAKGPHESLTKNSRDLADKGRGPDPGRREPPMMGKGGDPASGRFVVRAGNPTAYWIGMRVPFAAPERGFALPAKLLVRVDSLRGVLHLLNHETWVLAGTGVLLLSVLFWLPLVRGITRSLGQLTAATEQIAEGKFDTRVTAKRRDEIGKLGESVNRMATRLDAHMNGQKRFLGDVAHELCSPLARLQMATGILADRADPKIQETVADVREEVQQMSSLVNELLAFTKAGLRPRDVVCTPLDVAPLVREVLAREGASERVTLTVAENLRVMAEPDLLSRAIGNLIRNAVRYSGESGPISVSAVNEAGRVVIAVEDNGPGVPAGDLDRLGEPFFRPELARTRETGGVGLGLAIVRNSIASCGGEVRFANRSPRGFSAQIRLPAA